MTIRDARELFKARWGQGSLICQGLDPDPEKLPSEIRDYVHESLEQMSDRCYLTIEASKARANALKANLAFFEWFGADGVKTLFHVLQYARTTVPELPTILDFKRGDIGKSNRGYVEEAIKYFGADGITLNPYLGRKANEPFLALENTMLFFLCRTSNEESDEFQGAEIVLRDAKKADEAGLKVGDIVPLYQYVARRIHRVWNMRGNCGLVVGATYPEELGEVRAIVGNMHILAPGVGTQGGTVAETIENGIGMQGTGLTINVSSGTMYADDPAAAFAAYDKQATATLSRLCM